MWSQGREYQALHAYLQSLNFHFSDIWLLECVNYFKVSNPSISFEALKNGVKQQWLLADLRQIKVPSLPPDLSCKEKVILEGKYAVQVESMIDSSESCYSQFQKLRNVNNENIEATKEIKDWNIKPKRCLVFVISDGVQELHAMEYKPLPMIKTNDPELLPGFKMVIIGSVECRKGMLLLKEENVKICGGEVDTLTTTNNLKSLLIRNLELSEDCFFDSDSLQTENNFIESNLKPSCPEDQNIKNLLSQNDDVFLSLPLEPEILAQQERRETTNMDISNLSDYQVDELNEENVFDDIVSTVNKKHGLPEDKIQTPAFKKVSLDSKLNNSLSPSWKIQSATESMEVDEIIIDDEPVSPTIMSRSIAQLKKPVQTKLSLFFNSVPVIPVNKMSEKPKLPVCIDSKPFVYLSRILLVKLTQPVEYTIKAIILSLNQKIKIENDEYSLRVTIADGSSSIEVDFSSDIIEDFLGYSPCEMVTMVKAKFTNSAISNRVQEAFAKAKDKLISLNCLMNIKFFPDDRVPVVLSLKEVDIQHLIALKERSLKNI